MQGGLDWQLTRPNGVLEIEAAAILTTDDGAVIQLTPDGSLDL